MFGKRKSPLGQTERTLRKLPAIPSSFLEGEYSEPSGKLDLVPGRKKSGRKNPNSEAPEFSSERYGSASPRGTTQALSLKLLG